jgi:uncharacterized protein (DUF2252 family)
MAERSSTTARATSGRVEAGPRFRSRGRELTREERRASGRAARRAVSRSSLARSSDPDDRPDPVAILTEQARGRLPELVPIRNGRMLASPFAFFRGSAAVMAADLAATPSTGLRAQLCGDAHVSNFGGFASPERKIVFDLNDFDETLPGPWEWDVKRLAASLAIAGRGRGLDPGQRRGLVVEAMEAYREAMREFGEMGNLQVWYARLTSADILDRWGERSGKNSVRAFRQRVEKAGRKNSASATSKLARLVDGQYQMISAPPLVVPLADLVDGEERATLERAARGALRAYGRSLSGDRRALLEQFHYVDMARKVVGVGSVGTRAWVVLFLGADGEDPLVLQLKEARESVLAPYAGSSRFANQGQRVVEGQRLMQASSDIFLGWSRGPAVDGTDRDFYVRQLWDGKLSTDVERAPLSTLVSLGQMCGWTLARAHARSGDRVAIAAYLGAGPSADQALGEFAETYADRNDRDFELFEAAAKDGRIVAERGI